MTPRRRGKATALPTERRILILAASEVARMLSPESAVRAVERALRALDGGAAAGRAKQRTDVSRDGEERFLLAMPGYLHDSGTAGLKWVGSFSGNRGRGLPRVRGSILLTSAEDGTALALIEATEITALRTAALIAVAARHCAPVGSRSAAIVGFGAVGQATAATLRIVLPTLAAIRVHGGDPARLSRNAERVSTETGLRVEACRSAEEAVAGAEVVVTASGLTSDAPFVEAEWVAPGALVCAAGSRQEIASDLVLAADRLLVDDLVNAQSRGNLAPLFKAGRLRPERIVGDLAAVVGGRLPGRASAAETVVVSSTGLGVLDIAIARALYERARAANIGIQVPFG